MHDPTEHHAAADRLFAAAVRRVSDQRARVEHLRFGGRPAHEAEKLLHLFERTLPIMADHRSRLDAEMRRRNRGRG